MEIRQATSAIAARDELRMGQLVTELSADSTKAARDLKLLAGEPDPRVRDWVVHWATKILGVDAILVERLSGWFSAEHGLTAPCLGKCVGTPCIRPTVRQDSGGATEAPSNHTRPRVRTRRLRHPHCSIRSAVGQSLFSTQPSIDPTNARRALAGDVVCRSRCRARSE
jgi:hypothetical protein